MAMSKMKDETMGSAGWKGNRLHGGLAYLINKCRPENDPSTTIGIITPQTGGCTTHRADGDNEEHVRQHHQDEKACFVPA